MATDKTEPFRELADDLVARWMRDCIPPVCALSDELRLRATLTTVFAAAAPGTDEIPATLDRLRKAGAL